MAYRRNSPIDLIHVAKQQKLLLWLILLLILGMMGMVAAIALSSFNLPEPVAIMVMLGVFAIQIFAVVQAFRLTIAMRASLLLPIVMLLGVFIPLLGLIMLVVISSKANTMLQRAGVRVGLMGVPNSEHFKLMPGHCPMCGYDRQGLSFTGACPECGCIPSGEPVYRT